MNLIRSAVLMLALALTGAITLCAQPAPLPGDPSRRADGATDPGPAAPGNRVSGQTQAAQVLLAQPPAPRPRTSPPDVVGARIDGNRVTVIYGRPYTNDPKTGEARKIWGGLVPYGKVWRTGANEATLLITQQAIDLGGTTIPAGAYSLYTLPAEDGTARLLVNKKVGQWGADPYDETQELARIELKKEALGAPVVQFTMAVEKNPAGGGVIKLMWENTQYSVPFTVKK